MKWCRCLTKPSLIRGICQICKLEPAPSDERNENESKIVIIRPGIGVEEIFQPV